MNAIIIAKGIKNYSFNKIIPKKKRYCHIDNLLNTRISFHEKMRIFSDKKLIKNWDIIEKPTIDQKLKRDEYNIDIYNHILKYDPKGESIGCGCTVCALNNKISLGRKNVNEKKSILKLIKAIEGSKNNSLINLNLSNFLINEDLTSKYLLSRNKESLKSIEKKILKEIKENEKDLRFHIDTLKILNNLTGIPIKNRNFKKIGDREKYISIKKVLLNMKDSDLNKLSLEYCIYLSKRLNLCNFNKERVNNLKKIINLKQVTHLVPNQDYYLEKLKPDNERDEEKLKKIPVQIKNKIEYDILKSIAKKEIEEIHQKALKSLENYKKILLKRKMKEKIL